MREKIEYYLVIIMLNISKILPIKATYYLFDKIGILLFKKLKKRRKVATSNIAMVFKDYTEEEVYNLAKANFRSIARMACECLLIFNRKINVKDLLENPYEYERKIREVLSDNENGIIVFTAHFGNWEIMTKFVSMLGYKQLAISKKGENKLIEKYITTKFRNDDNIDIVYKNEAMSKIVSRLKKGGIVGLLADLKAGSTNELVPFFGKDAITARTIGALSTKYKSKIIPMFCRRLENNKYEIIIQKFPEIELSGNKKEDIFKITKTCNEVYENIIMQNPEQWFWMHRRWKI